MIRNLEETPFENGKRFIRAAGLSTDQKPTKGIITGSQFLEVDKRVCKAYDEENDAWEYLSGNVEVDPLTVTVNGTTTAPNGKAYNPVTVNVANPYTASDEGKVVSDGALVSQTSTTKNANGTYNTTLNNEVVVNVPNSYSAGDEGKVVSNGALVAQTTHAGITENGTYDITTNNSVTVNVPGSNVIISDDPPTPNVGSVGYYYIYIHSIQLETIAYGIRITEAARGSQTSFAYWGAREIDFVFTDGQTEYHLRDFSGAIAAYAYTESGRFSTDNRIIDGSTSTYAEHSELPGYYSISAVVPSGLALSKVRICGRNDSWHDFWRSFKVGQLLEANSRIFINTLISESDLQESDWDTSSASAYTEFVLDEPVAPSSEVAYYELYIKAANGWQLIAT